jgi:environmental stress-induced protein Ves
MTVTVVRRADHQVMPWRNGGGTTREIAVRPGTASGRFAWRLSIATVAQDGPFSAFAGYDRVIMVLDGGGMVLDVDGVTHRIARPRLPFAFAGEARVHCALIDGPIHDFNVMVDRATHRATVEVVDLDGTLDLRPTGATRAVVMLDGHATVAWHETLGSWDTVLVGPHEAAVLAGRGAIAAVTLEPSRSGGNGETAPKA